MLRLPLWFLPLWLFASPHTVRYDAGLCRSRGGESHLFNLGEHSGSYRYFSILTLTKGPRGTPFRFPSCAHDDNVGDTGQHSFSVRAFPVVPRTVYSPLPVIGFPALLWSKSCDDKD